MSLTPSTMLELGTRAPDFSLPDAVSGEQLSLADFADAPVLVVMFLCNHCPFVIHVHEELTRVIADYREKGVAFVAINSNDIENYPQDGPVHMAELVNEKGWHIPFLFDATQRVAQNYRAACTPDFFVFDRGRELVYRGRLDGSRPETDVPLTGADLRAGIDAALRGDEPPREQLPSMGCNIKWKAGNEPEYFG